MAVCRDGCAIYLVSRAEMISAHSHSGSVRAGRARGRTSRTFHTATLTRETLPARPDGTTHMLAHTATLKTENRLRLCTFDSEI